MKMETAMYVEKLVHQHTSQPNPNVEIAHTHARTRTPTYTNRPILRALSVGERRVFHVKDRLFFIVKKLNTKKKKRPRQYPTGPKKKFWTSVTGAAI
jgi:hypothetical protein